MPTTCEPWPGNNNAIVCSVMKSMKVPCHRVRAFCAKGFCDLLETAQVLRFAQDDSATWLNVKGHESYTVPTGAGRTAASPRSIDPLIPRSENSAATRTAFLIALAFDEPWVMMHAPFTPSNG